jgi:anti-sigma B factor antagonist
MSHFVAIGPAGLYGGCMRRGRHLRVLLGGAGERGERNASRGWLEHAGAERCVVALRGEWDTSNCDRFRELLASVTGWYPIVVIDLTQVTFADSTVLALAVAAQASQRAAGGTLRVVAASGAVEHLLDQTGLREVLDVYPSREAALRLREPA